MSKGILRGILGIPSDAPENRQRMYRYCVWELAAQEGLRLWPARVLVQEITNQPHSTKTMTFISTTIPTQSARDRIKALKIHWDCEAHKHFFV